MMFPNRTIIVGNAAPEKNAMMHAINMRNLSTLLEYLNYKTKEQKMSD